MLERLTRRRCHQVARVLQDYLDGETDPTTAGAVHDHLEKCRRCGLEAKTYQAIKDAIPVALAAGESRPVDPEAVSRLRQFTEALAHRDD